MRFNFNSSNDYSALAGMIDVLICLSRSFGSEGANRVLPLSTPSGSWLGELCRPETVIQPKMSGESSVWDICVRYMGYRYLFQATDRSFDLGLSLSP